MGGRGDEMEEVLYKGKVSDGSALYRQPSLWGRGEKRFFCRRIPLFVGGGGISCVNFKENG